MSIHDHEELIPLGRSAVDYNRKALFSHESLGRSYYRDGKYKAAADTFLYLAEGYRKAGAAMQQELLQERSRCQSAEVAGQTLELWQRRCHQPMEVPVNLEGLTADELWSIIGELQADPIYRNLFETIARFLMSVGDTMTWKSKAIHRWQTFFGLEPEGVAKFRWKPKMEEEILIEEIRRRFASRQEAQQSGGEV